MKRFFLTSALLLLFTCSTRAQDAWVEVASPNFKVNTNAGRKPGAQAAQRFEQMRQLFASLTQREKVKEDVPLKILAFKNLAGVKQVTPQWKGKEINVAGLYTGGSTNDFAVIDISSEAAWQALFHEYAHSMLAKNYQAAPLWFKEGFADHFSTIRITKEGAFIGDTPTRFGTVSSANLLPLEKFLTLSPPEKSLEKREDFYIQSWLLVHYIYDNKMVTRASRYFTLTEERDVPKAEAFQQAFGMTLAEVDERLRDYAAAKKMAVVKWNVPPGGEPNTFPQRKLKDFEWLALSAEMLFHSESQLERAEAAFNQILEQRPEYEPAHRGLGYLALRKKDADAADRHFRKAVSLNTTDPRVYYYLSSVRFDVINDDTTSEDLIEMAGFLDKAITLSPNFADAYALKSEIVARGRNLVEAISLGKRAIQLDPSNERYRLNLAFKQMYNGDLDNAIKQYTDLAGSQDAAIAEEAKKHLATAKEWKEKPLMRLNAHSNPYFRDTRDKREQEKISAELEELLKAQTGEADDDDRDTRPVKFVKGTLVSVDCSIDPGATITLRVAGKPMKLKAKSRRKVMLIGGDSFDCAWKNKKVAANYKVAGKGQPGDLVSLEIQ